MSNHEAKKRKFDSMMTLYGRKPVLEIMRDSSVRIYRLHLADSNADSDTINEICVIAAEREVEIRYHDRKSLSRISKNGRQDQGVAIDIEPSGYRNIDDIGDEAELIGLDNITNPQNLGMVIRSVAASPLGGLVLPRKGCAKIGPLVHKASTGSLLKANIYHSPTLEHAIKKLKSADYEVIGLASGGDLSLAEVPPATGKRIFLLGNETDGLRPNIRDMCHSTVNIPMANGVESINVAAAATLVAFRGLFS